MISRDNSMKLAIIIFAIGKILNFSVLFENIKKYSLEQFMTIFAMQSSVFLSEKWANNSQEKLFIERLRAS